MVKKSFLWSRGKIGAPYEPRNTKRGGKGVRSKDGKEG